MRTPTLVKLPTPDEDRRGWPWTVETEIAKADEVQENEWPKLSIIVPSFNQGVFLEETLRSILLQSYPDLELIIIDGGSTDESIGIIRKYESWIHYWVSERDAGQTDAINKGLRIATGVLSGWQNSDDIYLPGAFRKLVALYAHNPTYALFSGNVSTIDKNSQVMARSKFWTPTFSRVLTEGFVLSSQGVLWKHDIVKALGFLDVRFNHAMDLDIYFKILNSHKAAFTRANIGAFRVHENTKTSSAGSTNGNDEVRLLHEMWGYSSSSLKNRTRRSLYRLCRVTLSRFFTCVSAFRLISR